ncbi:hypothetical protein Tco_0114158, partial [Tanacetum coccineum]
MRRDAPRTPSRSPPPPPPPPPPPAGASDAPAPLAEYTAWTTIDTRIQPSVSSILEDLHMDDDSAPDEQWKPLSEEDRPVTPEPAWSIPSSDMHVPTNNWVSALAFTYVPPPENSLLAQTGDMATFMDWYCKKQGITALTQKVLEGPAFEVFSLYGYDYMKKIVLSRVDLKEHIIAERDFKYLYPSEFEDLYLLNLQ